MYMRAHKILIVDNNHDFRGRLRHHLETWGYEVMEAEEGAEEVKTALEESPDLLLLDYHMPYINGVQVAKVALAQRPDLQVLFITPEFERSFLAEMVPSDTHFMQKPFEMEDLQRNITHLLH
jgi:DNA-binding response OmpR family regulator